jgi:hypothetical protein
MESYPANQSHPPLSLLLLGPYLSRSSIGDHFIPHDTHMEFISY